MRSPFRNKSARYRETIILFLLFIPYSLFSQYFSIGYDPASVKWNKIKTENFTVIFPRSFEPNAQYIANAFEYFYRPGSASLQASSSRFPVILHTSTVRSNALVPYAPKRIELMTVPPQDSYSQDWIDGLILHEFRHTVQYAAVNRGFTRALSVITGQQAVPAILGLFVPFWFIEGDATINETAFGNSGRGRVPSFEMKLKAQFLERGIYNYDKAVHGSFEDFIPDRYELGYQIVGRTRLKFGSEVWAKTLKKVGELPVMIVPFSYSLKKQTGLGKVQLYRHITSEMKLEWAGQDQQLEPTGFETMTPAAKDYTNYTMPVHIQDGSILAIKKSIDDIKRIVKISGEREEVLFTPGTGFMSDALSSSDSLLCWAEMMQDPRWPLRDFSVIKTYQPYSGELRQITHKSRLFAPSIGPRGEYIVAVEVNQDNRYSLVIINSKDGSEILRTCTEDNLLFIQPAWSGDGERIASIVLGKNGKSLMIWEPWADRKEFVLPFTHTEISRPVFYGSHILFSGAYSGTDNIYALFLPTGELMQLTNARFGARDPDVIEKAEAIVYANYTADGYQLARTSLESALWTPQRADVEPVYPMAEALAEQENFIFHRDSVPDQAYPVKKYRKGLNLFNFHSWAPLSLDANNMDINPGVMLLSQNLLGTSYTTLGFEYDLNEEAGRYYLNYSFTGLYPAFDLGMDYALKRGQHLEKEDSTYTKYKYHELNLYGGISVPLSWSVRSWYMGIRPRAGYAYKFLKMDPASDLQFAHDRLNAINYRVFYYAQQKTSLRDLQPRWGQQLELNFRHTVFEGGPSTNSIFSSELLLYFPGFIKHHGFKAYIGYQERQYNYYSFSNMINTPRGQSGIYADKMTSASLTYVFPFLYPDWRLGPVFYLKRFKGAAFYDQTFLMDVSPYTSYNTIGLDLSVDFHFLSILAPLEIGLRSMYFPMDGSFGFQLLWGFNIDSLY